MIYSSDTESVYDFYRNSRGWYRKKQQAIIPSSLLHSGTVAPSTGGPRVWSKRKRIMAMGRSEGLAGSRLLPGLPFFVHTADSPRVSVCPGHIT